MTEIHRGIVFRRLGEYLVNECRLEIPATRVGSPTSVKMDLECDMPLGNHHPLFACGALLVFEAGTLRAKV